MIGVMLGWAAIRRLGVSLNWSTVRRPLFAAGMMGGGLIVMGSDRSLMLYLTAGTILYLISLTLLRAVPQDAQILYRRATANIRAMLPDRTR
jgi:hypothetical protein